MFLVQSDIVIVDFSLVWSVVVVVLVGFIYCL